MRLFKRPSTSPQLVSATPISQDEAASRTLAENAEIVEEVSSKLEEAHSTPKVESDADVAPENTMPPPSSSFSARKSVSTWGRKVGRRWDQLKRSDSSELLSVSGRRRRWSPNRKSLGDTSEDKEKCGIEGSLAGSLTKPKRISRVESLRNLFRASDHRGSSSNINGDISARSGTIEEEDDVTSLHHYSMDKALSEGALRNVAQFRLSSEECRNETLQEKKKQLSQSIKSFQEQQRVFDYILKNQEILKTRKGMSFARDTLEKVQTVLQNNVNSTEEEERTSSNVDLNKSDASTQTLDANKPSVKRNLFSVRTASGDSERSEQRRSFIGSGIEDLMCTLRLGCDESGYDSDSTRAGADSPDSEAIPSMLKRRSFSITSDDYQGIDLSLPGRTPQKKDATTVTCSKAAEVCGSSISGDCADSTFDESVRTDTTLMSDDDTDSCDEETFSDFPDFQFTGCLPPRNPEAATAQRPCSRKPKKSVSTIPVISDNLIAKKDLQKTPIKRANLLNEEAMPLAQRLRLQHLQKDRKPTPVASKGRRLSNASVLNLLENAASPSKDSPPASKIRLESPRNCVQYYSPKRSRSKLEPDGVDGVAAAMNPVKRVILGTPAAPPPPTSGTKTLVRRELKTMKLTVNREGNLGISVEKREAVRAFYVVSKLEPNGEAAKSKQIRVGDEVVRVSGRRLRGMSLAEARTALKNCTGTVELQIAREPTFNFDGELGDTWGEPIVRTRSDNAVWTLNEKSAKQENVDHTCRMDEDEELNNCRIVGALTKNGKSVSMHTMPTSDTENNGKSKLTGMRKFQAMRERNSMPAARPRRPNSLSSDLLTVTLEKGATKKLGFSIVGGSDSNKGSMGIFVKNVMDGGQAAEEGTLRAGDEILAINGQIMDGVTHAKALQYFKTAKPGQLIIHVGRKDSTNKRLPTKRLY